MVNHKSNVYSCTCFKNIELHSVIFFYSVHMYVFKNSKLYCYNTRLPQHIIMFFIGIFKKNTLIFPLHKT